MEVYRINDLRELPGASLFFVSNLEETQKCFYSFKNEFGFELPDDYIDFLKLSNGYKFKYLEIYGTKLQHLSDKDIYMESIVEKNKFYASNFKETGFVVIGKTKNHIMVYDTKDYKYKSIINESFDLFKTFDSFKSILFYYINKY